MSVGTLFFETLVLLGLQAVLLSESILIMALKVLGGHTYSTLMLSYGEVQNYSGLIELDTFLWIRPCCSNFFLLVFVVGVLLQSFYGAGALMDLHQQYHLRESNNIGVEAIE